MIAAGFRAGRYNVSTYDHPKRNLQTLTHGDDFLAAGRRRDAQRLKGTFEELVEVKSNILGREDGESKEETMKNVEDNYADLNLTVKVLGSVYDSVVRLLGSLQRSDTNFSVATLAALTEEDKFKENKKSQKPRGNFGMTRAVPYLNEMAEYRLINAGFESKKITIEGLDSAAKTLRTDQETFVFLKIVPTKTREDSIVPVNNGYLLKV